MLVGDDHNPAIIVAVLRDAMTLSSLFPPQTQAIQTKITSSNQSAMPRGVTKSSATAPGSAIA